MRCEAGGWPGVPQPCVRFVQDVRDLLIRSNVRFVRFVRTPPEAHPRLRPDLRAALALGLALGVSAGPAAGPALAQVCSYPQLTSDVPQAFAGTPTFTRFVQDDGRWAAVAVRSGGSAELEHRAVDQLGAVRQLRHVPGRRLPGAGRHRLRARRLRGRGHGHLLRPDRPRERLGRRDHRVGLGRPHGRRRREPLHGPESAGPRRLLERRPRGRHLVQDLAVGRRAGGLPPVRVQARGDELVAPEVGRADRGRLQPEFPADPHRDHDRPLRPRRRQRDGHPVALRVRPPAVRRSAGPRAARQPGRAGGLRAARVAVPVRGRRDRLPHDRGADRRRRRQLRPDDRAAHRTRLLSVRGPVPVGLGRLRAARRPGGRRPRLGRGGEPRHLLGGRDPGGPPRRRGAHRVLARHGSVRRRRPDAVRDRRQRPGRAHVPHRPGGGHRLPHPRGQVRTGDRAPAHLPPVRHGQPVRRTDGRAPTTATRRSRA